MIIHEEFTLCSKCNKAATGALANSQGQIAYCNEHFPDILKKEETPKKEAIRHPIEFRYDLIIPEFHHAMAEVLFDGAINYGPDNYKNSRLIGDKSPMCHIDYHSNMYKRNIKHDKRGHKRYHLAAIAVNAMMEFFYCLQEDSNGEITKSGT